LGADADPLLSRFTGVAHAAEPALEVAVGGKTKSFTRDALLAMPSAANITVPQDGSYGVPKTYRAMPIASLLCRVCHPVR
jgi:hypothetical protein